jgi:hypothetical protein
MRPMPIEPNDGQSGADVLLCTFESTNAGFSSFPVREDLSWSNYTSPTAFSFLTARVPMGNINISCALDYSSLGPNFKTFKTILRETGFEHSKVRRN